MTATKTTPRLDMRGKTITTYILFAVHEALRPGKEGDRVQVLTDSYPAIDNDVRAWCRTTGNRLMDQTTDGSAWCFSIEKGFARRSGHKLATIISEDGLLELLSPLGFALAAGLAGHDVFLYFQGPAVRVLAKAYKPRMHGLAKPFSRFPREGLAKIGHVPPQEKIAQLQQLGAQLYVCAPSMDHFKVHPTDIAFEGVIVAEYPTFMEKMAESDMQLFV